MLSNIKVIFSVKDAWQNGSYEIKDNNIVTIYRTAKNGRNRDGFLLDKYENIISYCDVCDLLIFISIFSKQYFESANLCYKKYQYHHPNSPLGKLLERLLYNSMFEFFMENKRQINQVSKQVIHVLTNCYLSHTKFIDHSMMAWSERSIPGYIWNF